MSRQGSEACETQILVQIQKRRSEVWCGPRAQVRVEPYAPAEGEDLSAAAEQLLSSATGGDAVAQIVASLAAQLNLAAAANASGAGAEGLKTRDILVSALTDADAESLSAEAVGRTSQVTRSACVMPFCEVI